MTGLFITLERGEGGGKSTTPAASTGRTAAYAFSPGAAEQRTADYSVAELRQSGTGEVQGGEVRLCRKIWGVSPRFPFPLWEGAGLIVIFAVVQVLPAIEVLAQPY